MTKRKLPAIKSWHVVVALTLLLLAVGVGLSFYLQGKDIPVLNPQGIIGQQEKNLILFTLLLSVIVVVPVFVMLGTIAWRYRDGNTKAKYTPDVEGNRWLETLWWGIPIVIIGILIVVTWVSTYQLDPYKPLNSNVKPITVQVVALQWRWLFIYPDQHVATVNELKIPAGTPINFQITADAPMSGFWIPSLGTQTYAMTGMNAQLRLESDKAGTLRGTNSNINGKGYAGMNFTVTTMSSRRDFDLWASTIANSPNHDHLAWDEYQNLVKPSTDTSVGYYHLHDSNLYSEIMGKYMSSGSMATPIEPKDGNEK
ncbi:MAG: Ubiquinol oxidase subunit 2 [Candidatus Saccharibacteria bacterium]|nr:Ubiquinol oxidase subunit 2 [Candidatus Saccharibacteria bacterium]